MLRADASSIVVCPMRLMPQVVAETSAERIVSVLNAHLLPPTPPGFDPAHHLKLPMSDSMEAVAGQRHPAVTQIEQLIALARAWPRQGPLVVHCFSGLNRSTAAAFILLCALNPQVPATLIAHRLREASDTAAPHRVMVALADQLLDRKGTMIGAIEVIGPGHPAAEGKPFALAAEQADEAAIASAIPAPPMPAPTHD